MPEGPAVSDALRAEAAEWFARMRGPEAERHRAAFERWCDAEPGRRAAYDRLALRWEQAALVGLTPSGRQHVPMRQAPPRRRTVIRYAALAASLVAVAAIGALLLAAPLGRAPLRQAMAPARELATPVGTIQRMVLADGSTVILDTGSRIRVAFDATRRGVEVLAGRIRFQVAHDAARPFVVAAGEGEVVATGTLFDVSLVGSRPQVRLLEGAVEVRAGRRDGTGASIVRLAPGQGMALGDARARPLPGSPVEDGWVDGMLAYEKAPLRIVIADANRYSRRQIVLAKPELGDRAVTGAFKVGDPLATAQGLAATFGLRVAREGEGTILLDQ